MAAPLRCEFDTDIADFAVAAGPWLDTDPIVNNVLATVIGSRTDGMVPVRPDDLWIRIHSGDRLVGVVIQTPPRGMLMPQLSAESIEALVDALSSVRPDLVGANGPKATSTRFTELWTARTGCTATVDMAARMFRVTEVTHPVGVPGAQRRATLDDLDVLAAWTDAFAAEVMPNERPNFDEALKALPRRLETTRPYWLWETDGAPMSMVGESEPAGGVVRLQYVYTPPEHRGHGYASACVARLSEDILARPDTSACVLFTDLANPTSNKIYQQIGYRAIGDSINHRFEYQQRFEYDGGVFDVDPEIQRMFYGDDTAR